MTADCGKPVRVSGTRLAVSGCVNETASLWDAQETGPVRRQVQTQPWSGGAVLATMGALFLSQH